ncbi:hypothetical protein GGX14DRAFT_397839 [Mycena pura]|uniref:Uncharacterized protein n=1 Tax=Mycena pura TaxID=153505 RepID=A0AAD6VF28_9AGAR|nr:hypothetical protein GGX14DRAFT_397839 [Mycena pura]
MTATTVVPAALIQGRVLDSAFGLLDLSFLRGFDFGPNAEEAFVRSGFAEEFEATEGVVTQLAGTVGVIQRVHSHAVTGREVAQRPSGSAYAGRRGTDGGLRWGCDSKAGDNTSGGMHIVGGTEGRGGIGVEWQGVVRKLGRSRGRQRRHSHPRSRRVDRDSASGGQMGAGSHREKREDAFGWWLGTETSNHEKHREQAKLRMQQHRAAIENSGPDRNITRRVHAKPSKVHVNQNFFYS